MARQQHLFSSGNDKLQYKLGNAIYWSPNLSDLNVVGINLSGCKRLLSTRRGGTEKSGSIWNGSWWHRICIEYANFIPSGDRDWSRSFVFVQSMRHQRRVDFWPANSNLRAPTQKSSDLSKSPDYAQLLKLDRSVSSFFLWLIELNWSRSDRPAILAQPFSIFSKISVVAVGKSDKRWRWLLFSRH